MSLYKVLEEVESMKRFQLVQKAPDKVELRIISDKDKTKVFEDAKNDLLKFFKDKGISDVTIELSDIEPQANKTSGKFKHIYKDF